MAKEEEKVVFVYELDKLQDDYRKCQNLSIRLLIREDISLLQKAISITENEQEKYGNKH